MIVLGVDPGFVCAGFSILSQHTGKTLLIECGALRMSSNDSLSHRVRQFHDFFKEKIVQHHVQVIALETPFLGKNAQNFLKLGYLRGILYLLADQHNLVMHEFAPTEIKRALTGFGGADKEQVARVMLRLFPGLVMPNKLDVTDAIAVSLCGVWKGNSRIQSIK